MNEVKLYKNIDHISYSTPTIIIKIVFMWLILQLIGFVLYYLFNNIFYMVYLFLLGLCFLGIFLIISNLKLIISVNEIICKSNKIIIKKNNTIEEIRFEDIKEISNYINIKDKLIIKALKTYTLYFTEVEKKSGNEILNLYSKWVNNTTNKKSQIINSKVIGLGKGYKIKLK